MKILNLKQGSAEWLAHRATARNASDAPAMLGIGKYKTRSQLLRERATGIEQEVDAATQRLFDAGHETEETARVITEENTGEELYPCVATDDDGYLSASFDGLTMMADCGFEHKLWNEELAAQVAAGVVPDTHWPQLEQQLLISGADYILFVVSDGTKEKRVEVEYRSDPDRRSQLISGWKQFDKDLADYEHVEQTAAPVGEAVTQLPSVSAQVSGSLEIVDNLAVFEEALRDFIDNRLIKSPQTDQDFADLDSQIKTLEKAESALDAAESNVLAMVSAVDAFKRTKDMLHAMARDNRLMAQKLLKAEKENRKAEILARGKKALQEHIAQINATLGKVQLPNSTADFAGAMKGKRTITSLNDAVDTELARAKIEANACADKFRANLEILRTEAEGYGFLFSDTQQLVQHDSAHLKLLVESRINEHKAAEEAKLEAERERIRAEEKAKAEAEAAKVEEQRQREIAETERASRAKAQREEAEADRVYQTAVEAEREPLREAAATVQQAQASKKATHKPTTRQIVATLCDHYQVSESTVRQWILEMDLSEIAA